MGGGSFTFDSFRDYSKSRGKLINEDTGYITSGQAWHAAELKSVLDPHDHIRECVDSEEHPNVIPVILALDVTGSMGAACAETAKALGVIMKSLYNQYQDIEIMISGIGDLDYDNAPLQVSQFESDVRIAEQLDNLFMEHGGGGNRYESYTAIWYYARYRTKIDAINKRGKRGIIITMGDEQLNPMLPAERLKEVIGDHQLGKTKTPELYDEVSQQFDVFHISIDDPDCCYRRNNLGGYVDASYSSLLHNRYKVSTIENLSDTICECINEALVSSGQDITIATDTSSITTNIMTTGGDKVDENGGIVW